MNAKKLLHVPDWVSPPGDTLLEIIGHKGMTQKELADRAEVTPKHISKIVNGTVPITPDMAIRLERVTGTSAKFWNTLEANFQTNKAKNAALHHENLAAFTGDQIGNTEKSFESGVGRSPSIA